MRWLWIAVLWAGCGGKKAPEPSVTVEAEPAGDLVPTFVSLDLESIGAEEDDFMIAFREDAACGDLIALEPAAMLGNLSDAEIGCLEDALVASERQTVKRKISLLLMADAHAKEEPARWEAVVRRHLETIDRSDPDICFKYAKHIAKQGAGKAADAIYWADVALENRIRFPPGDTTVARVYGLLKLKAVVAAQRWEDLEARYSAEPTPELDSEREDARNDAKTLAREWLEYALDSGKDATIARQLCVTAAGSEDFCTTS
jgi:hypothetical protein